MFRLIAVMLLCCQLVHSRRSRFDQPSPDRFNFFDLDLFEALCRQKSGNVLVSPVSVKITLGMLLEGAVHQSAEEIKTALRLPLDKEAARAVFVKAISSLQFQKSSNILHLANRLFLSSKQSVLPKYKDSLEKNFMADVSSINFEDSKEAAHVINTWVSNKTAGLIPSLVDESQIGADAKLMLANAVYFKGKWLNPFAADRTTTKCFHLHEKDCRNTLMMADSGTYGYGYVSALDAQALDLPYEDGKFSMIILLPRKAKGISQLPRDLLRVNLETVLSHMRQQEVYVQIPRFNVNYDQDLVQALEKLEISEIFGGGADFSGMLPESNETIHVSNVFHSAKITVNEEGSEAAAATGALFVPLMGGTTISFNANHPFLFLIRDTSTNAILFAGRVSETEEAPVLQSPGVTKKYESATPELYYQDFQRPPPPISNTVQKEQPYVMRKPGTLPPPTEQKVPASGFLQATSESVGVTTLLPTNDIYSQVQESTSEKQKPDRTTPPSIARPTSKPSKTTTPPPNNKKHVVDPSKNAVPFVVYGHPFADDPSFQELYRTYLKKTTIYDQMHIESETNKSRSRTTVDRTRTSLDRSRTAMDRSNSNVDRISFLPVA